MSVRKRLVTALVSLIALPTFAASLPKDAEDAYQAARTGYYALKRDEGRRKFRHNWLNVIKKFESVATHFPKSDRAPDALFTAGQSLEELSRISRLDEDLQGAMEDYQKLIQQSPKHRLADDAGYQLARIQLDRLGRTEEARKTASRMLDLQPKGDRARELRALLQSLPADKKDEHKAPPVIVAAAKEVTQKPDPVAKKDESSDNGKTVTASGEPNGESKLALVAAIEKLARSQAPLYEQKPEVPAEMDAPAELAVENTPTKAEEKKPAAVNAEHDDPRPLLAEKVDAKLAKARLKAIKGDGEVTLAEQLGLKVRRVVIDPGHGGHDSGAVGHSGNQEKDISLAISKKLAKELEKAGLEVLLTRDDDTFVRLEDRATFANDAKGDLFISVHCNSAPTRKLRGIEVYTLNTSSDRYSIRLAARENASSEKSISDLQFILADLATKANTEESSNLATQVQRSLVSKLGGKYKDVKDLGHKQALFYVLLGAKMPAVLVETSFLSNPEEEKRLSSDEYQDQVASAIAAGVQEFLGARERLAKVD